MLVSYYVAMPINQSLLSQLNAFPVKINFSIPLETFVCILALHCSAPCVKGVLDKYNINLFISNSIEDIKVNQYRNFQLIPPMRFHFMGYFVNNITFRVSHRLLYNCVFIEVDFEK